MFKKEIIHPENAGKSFTTGAYSAAVLAGGCLYISGQGPINFTTSAFQLGSIEEETRLTLHNIQCIVQEAGGTMEDVVKCNVHLADINDFSGFNKIYASFFPGVKPARTTVQSGLGHGIKVEIDAIALIEEKREKVK